MGSNDHRASRHPVVSVSRIPFMIMSVGLGGVLGESGATCTV